MAGGTSNTEGNGVRTYVAEKKGDRQDNFVKYLFFRSTFTQGKKRKSNKSTIAFSGIRARIPDIIRKKSVAVAFWTATLFINIGFHKLEPGPERLEESKAFKKI